MIYCPQCGKENEDNVKFCGNCGSDLHPTLPFQQTGAPGAVKYAGFWKRFVAGLIDIVIVIITGYITGFTIGFTLGIFFIVMGKYTSSFLSESSVLILGWLTDFLVGWIYFAGMEHSTRQATLGKTLLGIHVTDLNGNRISFGRATVRYFAKIVSFVILLIGFFMIGFTEKKQGLHDIIAGCLVIVKMNPSQQEMK